MRQQHQRLRGAAQGGAPPVPDAGAAAAALDQAAARLLPSARLCVLQFLHKDPGLACPVIEGVPRRYPVTNRPKGMLLIDELEEIVELLVGLGRTIP